MHPSLTSEHVLSRLFTHSLCTVVGHSVREEGGRCEMGGKETEERGGRRKKKRKEEKKKGSRNREGRGEEEKGRGEEWRIE